MMTFGKGIEPSVVVRIEVLPGRGGHGDDKGGGGSGVGYLGGDFATREDKLVADRMRRHSDSNRNSGKIANSRFLYDGAVI